MKRATWQFGAILLGWMSLVTFGCGDDETTVTGGAGGTGATGGSGGSGGSGGNEEPICGDGLVEGAETCDDGNTDDGDGCSSLCAVEPGYECDASGCAPICGDGMIVGDEGCDDGNSASGDGCDAGCNVESGYMCDGVPSICATVCGDGLVIGDEDCDDGNRNDGDGCSAGCLVETGFDCDASTPSICDSVCGDGLVVGDEECDDAGLDDGDGCSASCTVELGWSCDFEPSICTPECGDGLVNGIETCDDGNLVDGDGCSGSCQIEAGYDCVGEPSSCAATCGDGLVLPSEGCDDGNLADGDGCSSSCTVESNYICTGAPSVCTPLVGDTCGNEVTLSVGANTVAWNAVGQDYITTTPGCSLSANYNPDGPDVVMAFTASVTGEVGFHVEKPIDTRWHLLASDGPCGSIGPELLCVSEFGGTSMGGTLPVSAGTTYYFYIVDSTSGPNPLSNPLQVTITEAAEVCGDGMIVGAETCDDGNTNSGDGCSSSCTIESGFTCDGQPSLCTPLYGDTCDNVAVVTPGNNTIAWSAVGRDYFTSPQSCSSQALAGPDVVMAYTATVEGEAHFAFTKPASQRWHVVVSDGSCGSLVPQLLCVSEFTAPALSGSFAVTPGTTYYFYLVDTTSGSLPLSNPLELQITEIADVCGNSFVTGTEECDDGNLNDGDGCSSSCTIEPGYGCSGEPSVCQLVVGDNCGTSIALTAGSNTVAWTAVGLDYITSAPSCSTTAPDGPDLVMHYTATVTGNLQLTIDKPTSQRWHLLVSDSACGDITAPLACASEFTLPYLASGLVPVTAGTTYYFYLVDSTSGAAPLDNPLFIDVSEQAATCTPGMGGMVGDTVSTFPSGFPTTTEFYVDADDDPNGWVYVGGTTVLRRIPKAGGSFEDVHTLAGISGTHLGYETLIDGLSLFTVESKTTGTSGHFFRISTNGGASFATEDYASFAAVPLDDFRAAARHGGDIFLLTHEGTSSTNTEIYSMPAGAMPPVAATLVASFAGELNCHGLAVDNLYYYVACGTGSRLVRVDRVTNAVTLITNEFTFNTTNSALRASDVNSDGVADFLYVKGNTKTVNFICGPADAAPYPGTLTTFGTTSSTTNYGLGYDAVSNKLYAYDDGPLNIVVIE